VRRADKFDGVFCPFLKFRRAGLMSGGQFMHVLKSPAKFFFRRRVVRKSRFARQFAHLFERQSTRFPTHLPAPL